MVTILRKTKVTQCEVYVRTQGAAASLLSPPGSCAPCTMHQHQRPRVAVIHLKKSSEFGVKK